MFANVFSNVLTPLRARLDADERGSVAIIFAISIFVILGLTGLAIDYSRLVGVRHQLQALTDEALIAAATAAKAHTDFHVAATDHLTANWAARQSQGTASIVVQDDGNNQLTGTANTTLAMTFMKVLGFNSVAVSVTSSIVYGQASAEVALVLDTTGSMTGQPLQDLQAAAKVLLDTAYAPPNADQKVKVSVVPFAQYVNVGISNRNQPWMSVPPDTTTTSNVCTTYSPIISQTNCQTMTGTGYNDGVPYTYSYQQCTNQYGPPVTTCGPQTVQNTWNGCAGSRNYPLDLQAKADSSNPVPGMMNAWCGTQLLRLTNDRTAIDNTIASLQAGGETYIPDGLLWGWRALSPDSPFADATSSTVPNAARKVMVLMTDGANTKSPQYPDHEGTDAALSDTLMAATCTAIKAEKIQLYTVAFNVTDQAALNRLQSCASSPMQFFNAPNATALKNAFASIGKSLVAIYLSH